METCTQNPHGSNVIRASHRGNTMKVVFLALALPMIRLRLHFASGARRYAMCTRFVALESIELCNVQVVMPTVRKAINIEQT